MSMNLPNFYKSPHTLSCLLPSTPVLVGLSGGADSSCLLHLLCREREKHPFPLYAAHVNHGIRNEEYGNEADRDEAFCRDICKRLNVELFVTHVDVPLLAKNSGSSLETAARDVRYDFFAKIMQENQIPILAVAHNADDNLETQIFNLCRGCGISGICGIPEKRAFPEAKGTIVRPILSGSKKEILDYCEDLQIPYVTDSTNFENDCTRNRIRNVVIPELNSIFSTPQRSAMRLSRAAREDLDFISACAESFLNQSDEIEVEKLLSLHPSVAKRALTMAFEKKSGALLEEAHINSLFSLASAKKDGYIALPGCFWAIFEEGILKFDQHLPLSESVGYNVELHMGTNIISGTPFAVILSRSDPSDANAIHQVEGYSLFSKTRLNLPQSVSLHARSRREGDVILSGGMHKKVKKLLCDKKIPRAQRNYLPLICLEDNIIYIPQCAISDGFSNKSTELALQVSVYLKA